MPLDFTKEMKRDYTIIAPDIFPTHMKLIADIFRMYGYRIAVVRYDGREVVDIGLRYLHNDVCYPAICTVGQQLYALSCGDFDVNKSALIQFQTGGGCRASNYVCLLRKALHNMGLDQVPVIALSLGSYEHYSGFKVTPRILLAAIRSLVYGDLLMLLKNQTIPYEVNPGETEALVDRWTAELTKQFSENKGLTDTAMKKNLAAIAADFHKIPRQKKDLIKVGIVGEIYVKYSPFGNNGLEKFLLSQNCEYMLPGVLGFFQYGFANAEYDREYYGTGRLRTMANTAALQFASHCEKALIEAVKVYPEFTPPAPFEKVRELASRVIDPGVKMGEGWLLVGEAAELIEKGYENVICAQPFGCLPNHIVGKGTIRRLRELYPKANIFPVDYDAGASKVNQENRIKLMLAMAADPERKGEPV